VVVSCGQYSASLFSQPSKSQRQNIYKISPPLHHTRARIRIRILILIRRSHTHTLTRITAHASLEKMSSTEQAHSLLKQAEKRLNGGFMSNLFSSSSKYEDASELYEKAAIQFKLSKNWSEAAETYEKLTEMYQHIGSNHEVAMNFVESGNCYKKIDLNKAIEMFKKAAKKFSEIGRLSIAAKHLKEVGDMLEKEKRLEESLEAFTAAADLYMGENTESTANQCKLRVASIAGQLERYDMAIETFEDCAKHAAENNLLKYSAKGYLLNAGICRLCAADPVGVLNACQRYGDIDPTFPNSREEQLLKDLANASEAGDQDAFANALGQFDDISRLDSWKTTILLRAKKKITSGAGLLGDEDDLT